MRACVLFKISIKLAIQSSKTQLTRGSRPLSGSCHVPEFIFFVLRHSQTGGPYAVARSYSCYFTFYARHERPSEEGAGAK